jgi:DNA primase
MRDIVLGILKAHLPGPFRPMGANILTRCPIHKGGQERKPSFSVNLDLGVFHCFTCQIAGDITYLLKLLGLPANQIELMLKSIAPILKSNRENKQLARKNAFKEKDPFTAETILPEAILGMYEWMPPLLPEKGFDVQLLQKMEIGFDVRLQRITYPIRDMYGNLSGVSGGAVRPDQEPKYYVYKGKRQSSTGEWLHSDFGEWFDDEYPSYKGENHNFLWNFHRVRQWGLSVSDPSDTLFITEGFKACLWMIQSGYEHTVALMGSYVSEKQQYQLHPLGTSLLLCLDNDEAGRKATLRIGNILYKSMFGRVKCLFYPEVDEKTQPDDYPPSQLEQMVARAVPYLEYKQRMLMRFPEYNSLFQKKEKFNASKSISP